jgi:membrane protein YqaA with SNARE-associated domain
MATTIIVLGPIRRLLEKLGEWALGLTATLGGLGLFIVAFLDSSFISLPVANDLIVIRLAVGNPPRMPYYVLMATLGSLAGSLVIYLLARKGGEAYFRKSAGPRAARIRGWLARNAFLSIAIPSILPPPMPFKAFVIAAGVFQVPWRVFVLSLLVGRGIRYLAEGFLAVRYGQQAIDLLKRHPVFFTLAMLALVVVSFLLTRMIFRAPSESRS